MDTIYIIGLGLIIFIGILLISMVNINHKIEVLRIDLKRLDSNINEKFEMQRNVV